MPSVTNVYEGALVEGSLEPKSLYYDDFLSILTVILFLTLKSLFSTMNHYFSIRSRIFYLLQEI